MARRRSGAPAGQGPRPAAVTVPFMAMAAVAAAMHVISRTTGSGWLVVVVSFLLGVLGLAAILPLLALIGTDVRVEGAVDATAGRPVRLLVTTGGRTRGALVRLTDPSSEWVRVAGPATGSVAAVPARRGVLDHVEVEVRSGAPFGLVWWRRRLRVGLDRPLEVGPAALDVPAPVASGDQVGGSEESVQKALPSGNLPRGVRSYAPGDPPRLVSWVASARHGRLMVKEMEDEEATASLTLVVDLRGDEEAAEVTASLAAGMAEAALRQGAVVVLGTAEAGGPRLGPVTSPTEVGRRLARATCDGPPGVPLEVAGVEVVRASAR